MLTTLPFKKFILLGLIILAIGVFCYFHLYDYLTITSIRTYQSEVRMWTELHVYMAVMIYMLLFIVLVACAIPCATILTLAGGLLFGTIAIIFALISTTVGGMVLYLSVRSAIGSHLASRTSGWLKDMEHGFQRNAFNYLLSLRLVPIFPCWISNVAAGVFNVPLKTFLSATIIGILPATIIYVLAGRSLDKLLSAGNTPLSSIVTTPSVLFPLLGLAILSLIPVIYKSSKKRSD